MELLFGVSNFGKIRNAQIVMGGLTLFVGDNNSGKTFLMQLLYGLVRDLGKLKVTSEGVRELTEDGLEYGSEWSARLEGQINQYLAKNKKRIVRSVFHREIPIEKIYFRFVDLGETYLCRFKDYEYEKTDGKESGVVERARGRRVTVLVTDGADGREKRLFVSRFGYYPNMYELKTSMAQRVWKKILWGSVVNDDALFLPASRTGLQLLGKFFFAERDRLLFENDILDFGDEDAGGKDIEDGVEENELGLTSPVYDFLQFLLRYNPRSEYLPGDRGLIRFMEENLIDGKLKQMGEETFYRPSHSRREVPLYLASSLVNELAPMIKVLTGRREYKYIFYDEIETCLHPLKQGEMARLIIRLVNSGRHMVVSTHSDTMASKLNNLLLLSFSEDSKENRESKLGRLWLDEEDLLTDEKVHVYQFVNHSDGSSEVQELEFQKAPYVGYDFKLFMKNLDELYEETDIILE